jgi:predicted kinase
VNRKIIIIEGYLASGKSTFALRLSKAINVPYFIKDTFKSALCASIPILNREESSRFSAVTFDGMMYAAERLIEVGYPVIMEGNFVPQGIKKVDEAGAIKSLIDKYGCQPLTYKFMGDTKVLHKRFVEREKTPERGQANVMFSEISFEDFDRFCRNLDAFNVGGDVIKVDTTDFEKVDYEKLIKSANLFIEFLCK